MMYLTIWDGNYNTATPLVVSTYKYNIIGYNNIGNVSSLFYSTLTYDDMR